MKRVFTVSLIGLLSAYGFTTTQTADTIDRKVLTASCKKKIEPYKYDSQKFTKINFTRNIQQLEVEIPLFSKEKYRLVFNTSSLPKPIEINIYTKDKEAKKRKPIFTNDPNSDNEIVFDVPSRVRKMYVNYTIGADSINVNQSGFVVFMMGYK